MILSSRTVLNVTISNNQKSNNSKCNKQISNIDNKQKNVNWTKTIENLNFGLLEAK